MENKKSSIMYILDILSEYSDKEHPLTQKEIIDKIELKYDVRYERKSISANIKALIDLDYDIVQSKKGIYLASNKFDETQIKYLIDAIYSSKSISGKDADKLSDILVSFLSKYQRKKYSYIKKNATINRSDNAIFYNMEIINEAIKQNKSISFQYFKYDSDGKKVLRNNGYRYPNVSPYYLVNNFGKYYLIGKYYNSNNATNFRVDYMTNIEIEDIERVNESDVTDLGPNFKISDYINEHVYLFSGEVIDAVLEVQNDYSVADVYDWFGNNAKFFKDGNKTFARIKCNKNALVYWCLQYLKAVKVISPKSLQNDIVEILKENLDAYNNIASNDSLPLDINLDKYIVKFLNEKLSKLPSLKEASIEDINDLFIEQIKIRNEEKYLSPHITNSSISLLDNNKKVLITIKHFNEGIKEEDIKCLESIDCPMGYDTNYLIIINRISDVIEPNCFKFFKEDKLTWHAILGLKEKDWHKYVIIKISN